MVPKYVTKIRHSLEVRTVHNFLNRVTIEINELKSFYFETVKFTLIERRGKCKSTAWFDY